MAKITTITVSRLYNLGNYEHVRYELTIAIGEGDSATSALRASEKVLKGLDPSLVKGAPSAHSISAKAAEIGRMKEMTERQWMQHYGHCTGTREEVIARYEESLAQSSAERANRLSLAQKARELFDDLDGAEKWTDAKLQWEDGDY